jgi:hypothetical protein
MINLNPLGAMPPLPKQPVPVISPDDPDS